MGTRPLIQESLWLLNVSSINPLAKSKFVRTMGVISIIIYSAFTAEVFMNLIFNWNGLDSTDAVSQFVVDVQIVIKMILLFVHRKKLTNLLYIIDILFWPLDKFDSKLEKEILNGYGQMKKIFMCTFGVSFITVMAYSTKPFFSSQKMLPYAFYHPTDLTRPETYITVYVLQVILIYTIALPGLMGIDFLFISLITHIVNELRMLKRGFASILIDETLGEEKELEKIIPLINHHALVLGCIKDLNEIFSIALLIEVLASTFSICAGILGIISDGLPPDLQHIIKPVPYLMTFLSLSLLHCVAGTLLITETQSVADAAYESKWWIKTQPNVRRALTLVIQRANKTEKLSAGGMFDIDLLTYTNVVRTAFSFTMLAQAVFSKTN